jgi:hypothetical protein
VKKWGKPIDFCHRYVTILMVMKMQVIDLTEIFQKYQNKWVALTDEDKVICAGETLDEVMEMAKRRGYDEPVTMKIPNPRFELVLYVHPI